MTLPAGQVFFTAGELRNSTKNAKLIHDEIRAIENEILNAANYGALNCIIKGSPMTVDNENSLFTFSSVDTNSNYITVSGTPGYTEPTEVLLTTSGTLPAPLTTTSVYVAKSISASELLIFENMADYLIDNPVNITSVGSGTNRIFQANPSQVNYRAWQGTIVNRPASHNMNAVINHFKSLDYVISRGENTLSSGFMVWNISW